MCVGEVLVFMFIVVCSLWCW